MTKTLMKTLAVAAILSFSTPFAAHAADAYKIDPSHTTVIWSANHFGFSDPHGLFSMIEGTITLDDAAPANSKVEATINTSNLFTGNPKFDDHIKSKDFLNVGENTAATFTSTKVEPTGKDTAKVTGNLTLNKITKPVVLDVKFNKKDVNPITKQPTVGFSATATIKRSEFGIMYAIPGVSDDVKLDIQAEAGKAS